MATRNSSKAATGVQPKGLTVGLVAVTATFSVGSVSNASIASAGDVIQMIKVPKGATPVYVGMSGGAGTLIYSVGDGIDQNRYLTILSGSSGQALTPINTVYVPYSYSQDDTIDIFISTVSTASLVGGYNMLAIFSMDP